MPDDYKIIDLEHPIDLGEGKQLTQLKMEKHLKVKHLKMIPPEFIEAEDETKKKKGKDFFKLIPLFAVLCNIDVAVFEQMDFKDFNKVMTEFNSVFLNELSPPIGTN